MCRKPSLLKLRDAYVSLSEAEAPQGGRAAARGRWSAGRLALLRRWVAPLALPHTRRSHRLAAPLTDSENASEEEEADDDADDTGDSDFGARKRPKAVKAAGGGGGAAGGRARQGGGASGGRRTPAKRAPKKAPAVSRRRGSRRCARGW